MKPIPALERTAGLRVRERGVISILMAFLLVAGVIFILAQSMGIVGTRSMDTSQQLDSTAALMLAESGLQRAEAIVGRVGNSGLMAEADCKGVATGGPFALGRGNFSYSTTETVATPLGCGEGLCTDCTVNVTGTVGSASRTLEQKYKLGVSNGVAGRGTTVTMILRNIHDVPATSLFNMAWKRQDPGGNADATYCSDGASGCGLQWNLESSNGGNSVGSMGVTVDIPANTPSKKVIQTLSQSRDYVEVGGLFPSLTSAYPTIVGRFWDDKHVANLTGVNAGSTGGVIYGVATTGTCTSSPTTYPTGGTGSFQAATCTNWCSRADTLVFGVSGRSATSSAQITPTVTFGTNGTSPVVMTRLVHFPNLDGSTPNASGKAFSEIWYAYNRDYMLPYSGLGATSYPVALSATVGAKVNANTIANGATTMTVTSFTTADSKICIGDTLTRGENPQRFAGGTVVTTTPENTTGSVGGLQCSKQAGTYNFSAPTTNDMANPTVVATSTRLVVKESVGSMTLSTPLQLNGVDAFTPTTSLTTDTNVYELSTTPGSQPLALAIYTQGVSGTTISIPNTTPPVVPGTIVSVYSSTATGVFAAQTTVLASPAPTSTSFTVSQAPSTPLVGAAICGGICAFFKQPTPSELAPVTEFAVVKSSGTTQFASGFVCLSGVDQPKIAPVTSTTLTTTRWREVVE